MKDETFDVEQELADILQEEINIELIKEYGPDWKEKQDAEIIKTLKQFVKELEEKKDDEG